MTNKESKTPIVMDMEPGKKAWCSCGLTKNEPFCDGYTQRKWNISYYCFD